MVVVYWHSLDGGAKRCKKYPGAGQNSIKGLGKGVLQVVVEVVGVVVGVGGVVSVVTCKISDGRH